MTPTIQRKLTTILAADAEGYSRLMETDEIGALRELHEARAIFSRFIDRHRGRIANTAGDGLIAEFPSVVEAVQCAIEVQQELGNHNTGTMTPMCYRIGVHLGDVIVDGDDLLGEGVNLAARLQTMAEPGGVLISQQVYDQVHAKLSVGFDYLGEKRPRNYTEDVPVYRVSQGISPRRSRMFAHRSPPPRPHDTPTDHPADPPTKRFFVHPGTGGPQGQDSKAVEKLVYQAKRSGLLIAVLAVIDVATGGNLWVQWPALAMVVFLAYRAAPFFYSGLNLTLARATIAVGGLSLINLFSWSGHAWFLWPAGALIALTLFRRLSSSAP